MNMYTPFMVIAVVRRKRRNVIGFGFQYGSFAPGFPTFDIVLLGAGDDGHTFHFSRSGVSALFHPYEKSINPYNGSRVLP